MQTWQLKLANEFSPNYVRIVQGMHAVAFDRVIILGLCKRNPARMVGNVKSKKVKVDFWTLEEFQKVISLLYKGDYYEHYLFISFLLLFMTGMRIGEAAALQWDDIDFVIDKDTIRELKEWKEVQQKVLTDLNFVINYSGIPSSKHTLPRALEKLAGLAGIHRIKIHALRHSHVSLSQGYFWDSLFNCL